MLCNCSIAKSNVALLSWLACIPSRIWRIGLTVKSTFKVEFWFRSSFRNRVYSSTISSTVNILRVNSFSGCLWQFDTIRPVSRCWYTKVVPQVSSSQSVRLIRSWACRKRSLICCNASSTETAEKAPWCIGLCQQSRKKKRSDAVYCFPERISCNASNTEKGLYNIIGKEIDDRYIEELKKLVGSLHNGN